MKLGGHRQQRAFLPLTGFALGIIVVAIVVAIGTLLCLLIDLAISPKLPLMMHGDYYNTRMVVDMMLLFRNHTLFKVQ